MNAKELKPIVEEKYEPIKFSAVMYEEEVFVNIDEEYICIKSRYQRIDPKIYHKLDELRDPSNSFYKKTTYYTCHHCGKINARNNTSDLYKLFCNHKCAKEYGSHFCSSCRDLITNDVEYCVNCQYTDIEYDEDFNEYQSYLFEFYNENLGVWIPIDDVVFSLTPKEAFYLALDTYDLRRHTKCRVNRNVEVPYDALALNIVDKLSK